MKQQQLTPFELLLVAMQKRTRNNVFLFFLLLQGSKRHMHAKARLSDWTASQAK